MKRYTHGPGHWWREFCNMWYDVAEQYKYDFDYSDLDLEYLADVAGACHYDDGGHE